jgi:cytochrome d ubiquinol oxidase subunit I
MEYVPQTARGVTEWVGGVWSHGHVVTGTGIPLPYVDSFLVGFSPHTQVTGWNIVPPSGRPPLLTLLHLSFDLMVGVGFGMLAWGLWLGWSWWRHRELPGGRPGKIFLVGGALSGVATVAAMESGWVVTEVGRQPWTVYRILRTSQAATTAGGVTGTLTVTLVIYGILTIATFGILQVMKRRWQAGQAGPALPYSPPAQEPRQAPDQARHDR